MNHLVFVDYTEPFFPISIYPGVRLLVDGGNDVDLDDPQVYRIEHECKIIVDNGAKAQVICAPRLDPGHRVEWDFGRPTISPSILCPDCGLHGYVTSGRWQAV